MADRNRSQGSKKKKTDVQKRKTARKILLGGGVIGAAAVTSKQWIKPVVESTVLPAHADVSNPEYE